MDFQLQRCNIDWVVLHFCALCSVFEICRKPSNANCESNACHPPIYIIDKKKECDMETNKTETSRCGFDFFFSERCKNLECAIAHKFLLISPRPLRHSSTIFARVTFECLRAFALPSSSRKWSRGNRFAMVPRVAKTDFHARRSNRPAIRDQCKHVIWPDADPVQRYLCMHMHTL